MADVVRSLDRAILAAAAFGAPLPIEGAGACRPARCEVSGIRADTANRTIAITLVRPTGSILPDLASSAYIVPAATPLPEQKTAVIPSTGPYRVARFVPGESVTLTRNPHFHEWSAAAQPDGYPNSIVWNIDPKWDANNGRPALAAVAAGRADWADGRFAAPFRTVQAEFGSRAYASPTLALHGLSLNTHVAPFSDVKARQALALAIDRRAIANNWFGSATITCQFLPPGYPGHRPYCPFTLSRDDATGDWNGPDLLKAKQLVDESHTRNMKVTVWSTPQLAKALTPVVTALNAIGYQAKLYVPDPDHFDLTSYFTHVQDSRYRVQAGFYGWVPADTSAVNSLSLWRCAAYRKANPNNLNTGGFCDPSFDRALAAADRIPPTSPVAANDAAAALDRQLVDEVAWIPLVTPSWVDVVSSRVHNYKRNPVLGPLLDQMWLR